MVKWQKTANGQVKHSLKQPLHLLFHTEAISTENYHPVSLNDTFLITESYNH